MSAAPEGDAEELLTIGQVIALLSPADPSITHPKLRFWEDQGLVAPVRTASGYRKFSLADVERLRYISLMQREHYLPLKVIAEHLDAMDRGLEPPALQPVGPTVPTVAVDADGVPDSESFRRADGVRISRRELLKLAGVDEPLLRELESMGLVAAQRGTGTFTADALLVVQTVRELGEFGIEPRHLRAMKAAADREVGLIEQAVAPYRAASDPAAEARADDRAAELAALSVKLHATLIKAGLRSR